MLRAGSQSSLPAFMFRRRKPRVENGGLDRGKNNERNIIHEINGNEPSRDSPEQQQGSRSQPDVHRQAQEPQPQIPNGREPLPVALYRDTQTPAHERCGGNGRCDQYGDNEVAAWWLEISRRVIVRESEKLHEDLSGQP